jgi:hypothetical protein
MRYLSLQPHNHATNCVHCTPFSRFCFTNAIAKILEVVEASTSVALHLIDVDAAQTQIS